MYRTVTNVGEIRKYLSGENIVAFDFETAPDEAWRDKNGVPARTQRSGSRGGRRSDEASERCRASGDARLSVVRSDAAALDPHKAHVVGVSFAVAECSGIYVPLTHRIGENADTRDVWALLAEFAADATIIKVAHNLAFESSFLYKHGIILQPPCYDTIAAAQMTLKNNTQFRTLADSGLKTLVPQLFGDELPSFSDVTNGKHFDELDPTDTETIRYACADSDYTLQLYHLFNNWFDRWLPRHRWIVENIESPTAAYCGLMRYNGVLADAALMEQKASECESRLENLRDDIAFIVGDVNIGANCSTSAFKNYLYKDLELPVLKTTAKYQEAADDEVMVLLSEWCETNRPELVPLFKLVQEYRRWGKIKSTYIDGYAKHINTATGRIHADFMPLATETGRFACRKPNLQNCPRAGADDIGVRNFLIAPEGKVLLSLDFSQIELRVGAFYCRDEKMLDTYRTGGDIHDQTATVLFGVGTHDKEQRTIAKNVNFGTFYGLFPRGLQRTLKFKAGLETTLEECETIITNLKADYPELLCWQDRTKTAAKRNRYTETWLGRRRYLPGITSQDWSKQSFAERCALNTPIQGTAADILKLALGRIIAGLPERPWLRPLLQIHDELTFELPEENINDAVIFIKNCMETKPFSDFDVPIIADAAVGYKFGDMKDMEDFTQ